MTVKQHYTKIFNPTSDRAPECPDQPDTSRAPGDRRDGFLYRYNEETVLAVNLALAAERPLLVTGPSGCGKSAMARNIARWLDHHRNGWRYLEQVVTARTEPQDLLWRIDAVRRLSDAQILQPKHKLPPLSWYVDPGILWWAFDPEGALRRGLGEKEAGEDGFVLSRAPDGSAPSDGEDRPAVVLLDEIDKADPSVLNSLLVPLGSFVIEVPEAGHRVEVKVRRRPLLVLTSNGERDLPSAFRRRCIELELEPPTPEELRSLAITYFHGDKAGPTEDDVKLYNALSELKASIGKEKASLSVAEYLDTVWTCRQLGIGVDHPLFQALAMLGTKIDDGGTATQTLEDLRRFQAGKIASISG